MTKHTNDDNSEVMAALARIREIDKKWGTRHNLYEHLSTEPVGVEDWEIELVDDKGTRREVGDDSPPLPLAGEQDLLGPSPLDEPDF